MSDLDRSMHRSLLVKVAHSSFMEGSHTTKNTPLEPVLVIAFTHFLCKLNHFMEVEKMFAMKKRDSL